ncbi:MAG: hypothetical protein QXT25_03355 [Candidatus Anstonellaceae archaeon]
MLPERIKEKVFRLAVDEALVLASIMSEQGNVITGKLKQSIMVVNQRFVDDRRGTFAGQVPSITASADPNTIHVGTAISYARKNLESQRSSWYDFVNRALNDYKASR